MSQVNQYFVRGSGAESEEEAHIDGGGVSVVDVVAVRQRAQH